MANQQPPVPPTPPQRVVQQPPTGRPRRTILIVSVVAVVAVALVAVGAILVVRSRSASSTPSATDSSIPPAGPTTSVGSPFPSYNGNGADDNVFYNISVDHDSTKSACPKLGVYRPGGSDEAIKAGITATLACLRALNTPLLAEYEIELPEPKLVFYSDSVNTGCGDTATAANIGEYCSKDQTIYFSLAAFRAGGKVSKNPLSIYVFAAHEFGHYLQYMTNISRGVAEDATAESRRVELQATCTAGVFVNASWTQSGATAAMITQTHQMFDVLYGDNAPGQGDYGTPETTTTWFDAGYADGGTSSYADCNTFAAPLGEVR